MLEHKRAFSIVSMVKKSYTDSELAVRSRTGDEPAFQELVSRYQEKLSLYLRHLTLGPDESKDLVQEVFIKAYRALPSFDGRRRFSPWIYRIAHNEAMNYLKRKNRRKVVSWEDISDSADELDASRHTATPEDLWANEEEREMVKRGLVQLSEPYREVLILRYYLDKSYAEMSEILGKPENTVASTLSRAKKKLAKQLDRRKKPREKKK